MGLRINTNLMAITAQQNLYKTNVSLSKSLERLSSGLRVNRSGDDAAGMAISSKFRADIRALGQASRNINDAISMVQTMEGAVDEVTNILIRLKELGEQAANGTLDSTTRSNLDSEFQKLVSEIDRIASTTDFNDVKLLTGAGSASFQVGIGSATAINQIKISLASGSAVTSSGLGVSSKAVSTSAAALTAMSAVTSAINILNSTRATFGATQNRLESAYRTIQIKVANFTAAESRIRDVDVANETAQLTRNSVLAQAGVAVLVQANQQPSLALSLLG